MTTYKTREEVKLQEKWDLSDLYSNGRDWDQDYLSIENMAQQLKAFDGNIHDGNELYQYLKQSEELSFLFNKLYAYAMLKVDENTRETSSQSLLDRAKGLSVKVSAATSFFMPYLLSLSEETLKGYLSEEKGLDYFEKGFVRIFSL